MKRFSSFLTESRDDSPINIEHIYGELRQAGIHAGNRLCEEPLVATRGFAALNTAAHRVEAILKDHGILLHEITEVERPRAQYIMMEYTLSSVLDERRIIGSLRIKGKINPIDKGTIQFHAELNIPQGNII